MTIHVTQDNIDRSKVLLRNKVGSFLDKFADPITLAIGETLKAKRCMTHPYTAEVDGAVFNLSDEAIRWSKEWCQGIIGQPFSFTLSYVSGKIAT